MKAIVAFSVLLFSYTSFAGILLEPFVGYDSGTTTATTTAAYGGTTQKSKLTGTSYGARLGYRFTGGFLIAGEYTASSGKVKDDAGVNADVDYTHSATGLYLGFDQGLFRAWLGYGFTDKLISKSNSGDDTTLGTNMKIGIGVMPIRHLSVNLEYFVPTYKKYTAAGQSEVDVSTIYSKYDSSVLTLSLSTPFDFGGK